MVTTLLTLHTKDVMIKRSQKIINDLQEKNRTLEMQVAGHTEEDEALHEKDDNHGSEKTPYFRQHFRLSTQ